MITNDYPDLLLMMILVALVTAAVLLLKRTHSRRDEATRTAIRREADADLRRLREDLRSVTDQVIRTADRALSIVPPRTTAERARSELMEPPEGDRAA